MQKKFDPLVEAVSAVVASDDETKRRVQRLIQISLSRAEQMMMTGSADIQLSLIKSVVPAMVKMAGTEEKVDEHADLRAEMQSLMAEVRDTVAKRPNVDDGEDEDEGQGPGALGVPVDGPVTRAFDPDSTAAGIRNKGGASGAGVIQLRPASG